MPALVSRSVFDLVDGSMLLTREEVFGPVLAEQPFSTRKEVLAPADAVAAACGLLVGVWTKDLSGARAVAREVRSRQVSVNELANQHVFDLPFNVTRQSGFNHGGGHSAVDELTREEAVTVQLYER
ncbi:MAG TPA: aldehyde dehydrogenase family protein [Acidimicrobiales bacterium]|nr:aldehyde dehydrogenase family protein [Acidimicrobiales bacterium]